MSASLPDPAVLQQILRDLLSTRYMTFATSTMFIYDFILGISEDVRMFSLYSLRPPDLVYLFARILTAGLSFLGLGSISITLGSCFQATITIVITWVTAIVLPCNCWLFFLRARAVYFHSKIMVGIFAILWAATLTSFGSLAGYKVHSTRQEDGSCEISISSNKALFMMPFIALVLFDTAVVVAITFHAVSQLAMPWRERVRVFWTRHNIGRIQRTFLVTGQIYYIATIGIHLSIIILLSLPSVSDTAVSNVAAFSTAFHNIMASHVFRLLKLSPLEPEVEDIPSSVEPIQFRAYNTSAQSSYITSHAFPHSLAVSSDSGLKTDSDVTELEDLSGRGTLSKSSF